MSATNLVEPWMGFLNHLPTTVLTGTTTTTSKWIQPETLRSTDGSKKDLVLSGALICAQTILEDLLTIRADRDLLSKTSRVMEKTWGFFLFLG